MLSNSVAVMQPYFFPNLSYYKLVCNVEIFVFYNDVHFIKGGWINKNNILQHGKSIPFRLPIKEVSQNKIISSAEIFNKENEVEMLLKKLHFCYAKAPYYQKVKCLIEDVLQNHSLFISDIAELSIRAVFAYLKYPINTVRSSELPFNRSLNDKSDRIISLVHFLEKNTYLNAIGGKSLYNKSYFKQHGIDLFFIQSDNNQYKQFNHPYVHGLSMIDVLMFNSPGQVINMLNDFSYE